MSTQAPKCKTCRFWLSWDNHPDWNGVYDADCDTGPMATVGDCRRFPPSPTQDSDDTSLSLPMINEAGERTGAWEIVEFRKAAFPATTSGDWCGEYSSATKAMCAGQ